MVVFSPIVLLLCTLWELSARFFNIYSAFTDQKKKKKNQFRENCCLWAGLMMWKGLVLS